jgi:hypothetical protein
MLQKKRLVVHLFAATFGVGACSFMGDVMHAEGDYAHKIGDAFKRQGARREAAKARAAKKVKTDTAQKSDKAVAEN